jgi:hypothetical protein
MKARPPVTTAPGTLTQRGTAHPPTTSSIPVISLTTCRRQISQKTKIAVPVNGFISESLFED